MGYMGFGMRKEVYTRKPRKPFEMYKEYVKKTRFLKPIKTLGRITNIQYWNLKQRFVHLSDSWIFRAFIAGLLFITVSIVLWRSELDKYLVEFNQNRFEKAGITTLYHERKDDSQEVHLYFWTRRDRIYEVSDQIYFRSQNIELNSQADTIIHISLDFYKTGYIENDNLIYEPGNGEKITYMKNWVLRMNKDHFGAFSESFYNYLETDQHEIKSMMDILTRYSWTIFQNDSSQQINFEESGLGNYALIFSEKPTVSDTLKKGDEIFILRSGIIEKGVYWKKMPDHIMITHK
jgi:hypothetical protein